MFDYIEEVFNSKAFFKNSISRKIIDRSQTILNRAYQLNASLKSDEKLQQLFKSIDPTDAHLNDYVTTLIVTACIRSCGKIWHIHTNTYTWNIIPRIPQIAAALQLCNQSGNQFALQRTGEGKTVTILLTIAQLALHGTVHVVTANDYLASRDCQWIGPVLKQLGIECSFLVRNISDKKKCYQSHVLFGSDKEFLFDYLRDSMRSPDESPFCSKRQFLVVDEGDHILLDELLTPAILSVEYRNENSLLMKADSIVRKMMKLQEEYCVKQLALLKDNPGNQHSNEQLTVLSELRHCGKSVFAVNDYFEKNPYLVEASERYEFKRYMRGEDSGWYTKNLYFDVHFEEKTCTFTDRGMKYIENEIGCTLFTLSDSTSDTNYDHFQYQLLASLQNSLEAHVLLRRDVDYIVRNREIEVITLSTGRADCQKKFGRGLAGSIAVKEGVEYQMDSVNITKTVITGFVKEYKQSAVLSGTLLPDHIEFEKTYAAKAFPVPTCKPIIAKHASGQIFANSRQKYKSILDEVLSVHEFGRPVLIGTNSIIVSENIERMFRENNVSVQVINAKNEDEEAQIISQAGNFGAITIATNMAGRGCDILVSRKTEYQMCDSFIKKISALLLIHTVIEIECSLHYELEILKSRLNQKSIAFRDTISKKKKLLISINGTGSQRQEYVCFGLGLHVVIAECCSSRRIEMQLRGRTGRQGNPGSSSLFISLDDEALMPVSSVRWFGYLINRWFGLNSYHWLQRLFLSIVYSATENDMRFRRSERQFYDGITEVMRKRLIVMRERAISLSNQSIVRNCIRSYISYLNEEITYVKHYDERISMILSKFQDVLYIDRSQLPEFILDNSGVINSGIEKWIAGLLIQRKISLSGKSIVSLYCSCIDEIWSTFLASLDSIQEQADFWLFAGRDAKVTYIDIIFSKWHESMYQFFEYFLRKLFNLQQISTGKLNIGTNLANDEIEKLFTL